MIQSKKKHKLSYTRDIEKGINLGLVGQSSSSCSSEDDSIDASPSLSMKGPAALNLKGKKRASRGSANDPQSVYASVYASTLNQLHQKLAAKLCEFIN